MSNLTSAKSQKAEDKPIGFILRSSDGTLKKVLLFIRPEDLSISFPSRVSVNQTLGGAFVDSFGEGLETINAAGTTGWRTDPNGKDGIDRLIELKGEYFTKWHTLRQNAIKDGKDPNEIKLYYVDTLNRYASAVVPHVFELKRSKSRPLLCAYRFSMTGLPPDPKPASAAASATAAAETASGSGLSSLIAAVKKIVDFINSVKNFINTNILGPIKAFMTLTGQVMTLVKNVIAAGLSIGSQLISVARAIAQTGLNIFRTLAAVASIPAQVRAMLMQVAAAYSNIFCVLKNALKTRRTYEDYGAVYGASNCSSTAGGLPPSQYADANVFYAVTPSSTSGIGVSVQATNSMNAVARSDVVMSPMSTQDIGTHLTAINAGVVVK